MPYVPIEDIGLLDKTSEMFFILVHNFFFSLHFISLYRFLEY